MAIAMPVPVVFAAATTATTATPNSAGVLGASAWTDTGYRYERSPAARVAIPAAAAIATAMSATTRIRSNAASNITNTTVAVVDTIVVIAVV